MDKPFLYSRQKVILALLEAFGGTLPKTDMQKYIFLFTQRCQKEGERSYDFIPYKYGCYSFQFEKDRQTLADMGIIFGDDWRLPDGNEIYLKMFDKTEQSKMRYFAEIYKKKHGDALLHEVYTKYPYYAINSEVKERVLNLEKIEKVKVSVPHNDSVCFFTIGYEGKTIENYINRLIKNNIHLVCDVRANPFSRKYGFSQRDLSVLLKKIGIEYVHMPELGIVSDKRQALKTQEDYDALFSWYEKNILPTKIEILNKLRDTLKQYKRIAITCFEADVKQCHRGRIAKILSEQSDWNTPIEHI
nr:MAG TPA: protein of unknown function DUF488 [Caudoviricetes sp.]